MSEIAPLVLPERGGRSITNYLALLKADPTMYPFTPLEIYLAVCQAAPNASTSTKKKWKRIIYGLGN